MPEARRRPREAPASATASAAARSTPGAAPRIHGRRHHHSGRVLQGTEANCDGDHAWYREGGGGLFWLRTFVCRGAVAVTAITRLCLLLLLLLLPEEEERLGGKKFETEMAGGLGRDRTAEAPRWPQSFGVLLACSLTESAHSPGAPRATGVRPRTARRRSGRGRFAREALSSAERGGEALGVGSHSSARLHAAVRARSGRRSGGAAASAGLARALWLGALCRLHGRPCPTWPHVPAITAAASDAHVGAPSPCGRGSTQRAAHRVRCGFEHWSPARRAAASVVLCVRA